MDQIIQHLLTPLPELTSSQKADLEKVSLVIVHIVLLHILCSSG